MEIKLNRKLYDKDIIIQAAKDYSDICEIKFLNDSYLIEIYQKKGLETIKDLDKEFANYVLGLMKSQV